MHTQHEATAQSLIKLGASDAQVARILAVLSDGESHEEPLDRESRQLLLLHLSQSLSNHSKAHNLDEADAQFLQEVTQALKELFKEDDWTYTENRANYPKIGFDLSVRASGVKLQVRIDININPRVCRIRVMLPNAADRKLEYLLCHAIAQANLKQDYGTLQYNEKSGELQREYQISITQGLCKSDFQVILNELVFSAADDYEQIQRYCTGRLKNDEIVTILKKIETLVNELNDIHS